MKEVIKVAQRLHSHLEAMADGAAPTTDFQFNRAYEDLLLVSRYIQLLLTDSPSMVGPLRPILKALTGDDQEEM